MKRGISRINAIIILVVSLIIFLSIEAPLLAKLISKEKDEKCAATAAVHKATKIGISGDSSPVPIDCPRTYINFYGDHLEIDQKKTPIAIADGNRKTIVDSYKALNSQVVYPVLAERMRICWKNFGEAGGSVFDRNKASYKNVCVFCAQFQIDSTQAIQPIELGTAFTTYLSKATLPFSDQNYYSYFTKNGQLDLFWFYSSQIAAGKTYYLIYHNIVDYKPTPVSNTDDDEFRLSILDEEQLLDNQNMLRCEVMYG
ncbi:hypothetical protein HZA96_04115 [Candidatus Woesearchaeota archaeon]|nr:hypothetical protein [Candidatus Woesearchaeota archaeon]